MKLIQFQKVYQVSQISSSLIKLIKVYGVYLGAELTDLWNMYKKLAINNGFRKVAAIILLPTRPNFENVHYSLGTNNSFCKNDENSLCFKRNSWESLDEKHEKEGTTTKGPFCNVMFWLPDSL